MASWHVYLVLCRDESLYCGIAASIPRRIAQHNAGTGAKYIVPSRRPVVCVWKRRARDQGDALRLEYWLKQLDPGTKMALVERRRAVLRARDGGWRIVPGPGTRAIREGGA
jgi:putative endonuclease